MILLLLELHYFVNAKEENKFVCYLLYCVLLISKLPAVAFRPLSNYDPVVNVFKWPQEFITMVAGSEKTCLPVLLTRDKTSRLVINGY